MTKIAHVIALVNAGIGLLVLLEVLTLTDQQIGGIMGFVALIGAAVGAFFDPRVPWYGNTTVEVTTPAGSPPPTVEVTPAPDPPPADPPL